LRTRDGGVSWTVLPEPPVTAPFWVGADTMHATRIHFANESDGWLWARRFAITHDGGLTWSAVTEGSSSELWSRMKAGVGHLVLDMASDADRAYMLLGCDPRGHCPNPAVMLEAPLGTDDWDVAPGSALDPREFGRFAIGGGEVVLQSNDHNTGEGRLFVRSRSGGWGLGPYPCDGPGAVHLDDAGQRMVACAVRDPGGRRTQLHISSGEEWTWQALASPAPLGYPLTWPRATAPSSS
jgi:hypothetical protein